MSVESAEEPKNTQEGEGEGEGGVIAGDAAVVAAQRRIEERLVRFRTMLSIAFTREEVEEEVADYNAKLGDSPVAAGTETKEPRHLKTVVMLEGDAHVTIGNDGRAAYTFEETSFHAGMPVTVLRKPNDAHQEKWLDSDQWVIDSVRVSLDNDGIKRRYFKVTKLGTLEKEVSEEQLREWNPEPTS